jgi:hypothetical protein
MASQPSATPFEESQAEALNILGKQIRFSREARPQVALALSAAAIAIVSKSRLEQTGRPSSKTIQIGKKYFLVPDDAPSFPAYMAHSILERGAVFSYVRRGVFTVGSLRRIIGDYSKVVDVLGIDTPNIRLLACMDDD